MLPTPSAHFEQETPLRTSGPLREDQIEENPQRDEKTIEVEIPNNTLYINNINEKLKKPFLRTQLYLLGTAYGQILDIVALKSPQMRGQGFIVYKELEHDKEAHRELNGRLFFGKRIQVRYAKTKSRKLEEFEKYILQPIQERAHKLAGSKRPHK
jgi:RNA recognition motif-containing protein